MTTTNFFFLVRCNCDSLHGQILHLIKKWSHCCGIFEAVVLIGVIKKTQNNESEDTVHPFLLIIQPKPDSRQASSRVFSVSLDHCFGMEMMVHDRPYMKKHHAIVGGELIEWLVNIFWPMSESWGRGTWFSPCSVTAALDGWWLVAAERPVAIHSPHTGGGWEGGFELDQLPTTHTNKRAIFSPGKGGEEEEMEQEITKTLGKRLVDHQWVTNTHQHVEVSIKDQCVCCSYEGILKCSAAKQWGNIIVFPYSITYSI